jgi:hypothetical protein
MVLIDGSIVEKGVQRAIESTIEPVAGGLHPMGVP